MPPELIKAKLYKGFTGDFFDPDKKGLTPNNTFDLTKDNHLPTYKFIDSIFINKNEENIIEIMLSVQIENEKFLLTLYPNKVLSKKGWIGSAQFNNISLSGKIYQSNKNKYIVQIVLNL